MEGPSIRKVMQNAKKLFGQNEEYIQNSVQERKANAGMDGVDAKAASRLAPDDEIKRVCENYGQLGHLLDGIISKYNTERGAVTESLINELEGELHLLMIEWDRMGLSKTRKFHIVLDHG